MDCPPPAGCGCEGPGSTRHTSRAAPHVREAGPGRAVAEAPGVVDVRAAAVVVLDTGLAPVDIGGSLAHCTPRPAEQWGPTKPGSATAAEPYQTTDNLDLPDSNADRWIDPVAGHGTFIGSLISRLAPGAEVTSAR